VLRNQKPPMPLRLIPIEPGCFFEAEDFSISAIPVRHRGPDCMGFLFEEKGRRPFLAEKAETLGIPNGPLRRDLVAGKSITLPEGTVISPEDVLGEFRPGTRLVLIGDTGETDTLLEHCRGADGLVIESTYLDQEQEMAAQFSHLTARQAAELARNADVRSLFLTHVSRRYRDKEILVEAQSVFPDAILAHDFDTFQVKHD
jgi:ribonuclease Z